MSCHILMLESVTLKLSVREIFSRGAGFLVTDSWLLLTPYTAAVLWSYLDQRRCFVNIFKEKLTGVMSSCHGIPGMLSSGFQEVSMNIINFYKPYSQ